MSQSLVQLRRCSALTRLSVRLCTTRSAVSVCQRVASFARPLALLGTGVVVARPRSLGAGLATTAACEPKVQGTVLVRNGEASKPWLSKGELLKEYSGAYTTARTVDQKSVFEFSMHCRRLCQTMLAILRKETGGGSSGSKAQALAFLQDEATGAEKLKPLVTAEVATALQWFGDHLTGTEYQVTVLMTCDTVGAHTPAGRGFDIFTFVQPMPQSAPMVGALAQRADRNDPTIKDAQWVVDRQQLEEVQKKAGVNELVMFDKDGFCTEGLSSNFFCVTADGTVLTAPDDRVLAGTVRKVVLEVAKKHGIPVRLETPNIKDFTTWDSCFVCSTSRLAKPICQLDVPELQKRKEFPAEGSVAHRLEVLVREAVRENSELLF